MDTLTIDPRPFLNEMTQSSDNEILAARDVYRTFEIGSKPIEVLKGVTLSVNKGEKLFLCGASGAGKTSLLYTLAGLEKPNEGQVIVDGHDLYNLGRREQAKIRNEKMGLRFPELFSSA